MRFLHTADWHLGRAFHGARLVEDQAHILRAFIELAESEKPDAVVIAGDVYDRALPAPEAVELLDDTLSELVLRLGIPVILIAGNHDSPVRLDFAAGLLGRQRLHVAGSYAPDARGVTLADAHGEVVFYPLPYAEPAAVRQALERNAQKRDEDAEQEDLFAAEERIDNHPKAVGAAVARIRERHPAGRRSVLVGHAFVMGGANCPDSERPLSIGGAECVDPSVFSGFDYVALGHLHQPQSLGDGEGPAIHYAGSLLKYSFSECTQKKSVNLVEMDAAGRCRIEKIPLPARRDVRRLEGELEQLMTHEAASDDYLWVTLTDRAALHDPIGRLRLRFPNVMQITQPGAADGTANPEAAPLENVEEPIDALFTRFFESVAGEAPTSEELAAFRDVAGAMQTRMREA